MGNCQAWGKCWLRRDRPKLTQPSEGGAGSWELVSDFQPDFPRLCPLLFSLVNNIVITTITVTIKVKYLPYIVVFLS